MRGLSTGQTLAGGRLVIGTQMGTGSVGKRWAAADQAGDKYVVELLPRELDRLTLDRLDRGLAVAKTLAHPGIAAALGADVEDSWRFALFARPSGVSLKDQIAQVKKSGRTAALPPELATSVALKLIAVLEYATPYQSHGSLSPETVFVSGKESVSVIGYGLSACVGIGALGDAPYLAPELRADPSREPDEKADIFGVGALLWELLTGVPPDVASSDPSEAPPHVPTPLAHIVAACLSPAISDRPKSLAELAQQLTKSLPAPAAKPAPPKQAESEDRYLVRKKGLDLGPYSMAGVIRAIERGEIAAGDLLIDRHAAQSAPKVPLEKHPELTDVVRESAHKFEMQRRAQAEVAVVKRERRGGRALYSMFALIAVAVAISGYFAYTKLFRQAKAQGFRLGASELEVGSIQVQASATVAAAKDPKGGARKSVASGGGGGTAWNDVVDLGDASQGGGSETLPGHVIDGVLAKSANRLAACIHGSAQISLQIYGTGKVGGVKVNGSEAGEMASCIRPRLQALTFPSFNGPRMAARFSITAE